MKKDEILREFIRKSLRSLLSEGQPLLFKHLIGGVTNNPVVQKSIDANKVDTYELNRSSEILVLNDPNANPENAIANNDYQASSKPAGEKLTLISTSQSDLVDFKGTRHVVVKINSTGEVGLVPLTRVDHNMGHGGKKGVLSGQILGQAVEHAVAGGLSGAPIEEIIEDALNDGRHAGALANAADEDIETFKQIVTMATEEVRPWQNKMKVTDASVDAGPTALVDVPAEGPNGPIAVHVKYNDPSRLFGLQQKMKKGESVGSPSTKIFRDVRGDFVRKHLLSAEAYKAENPEATPEELKIIDRKGGTNDGSVEPVLRPAQFIRNNPALGDMPTALRDPQKQFMQALLDAGYTETLSQEIKSNLSPEGAPTYYFKFKGGKGGLKLDVQSFDLSDVEFELVPTFDGTVTAFKVTAVFPGGRQIEDVLNVTLPSSRRGHPPQINAGKNYKQLLSVS